MEGHDAATRRAHELADELRTPITMMLNRGGIDLFVGAAAGPHCVVIYPTRK